MRRRKLDQNAHVNKVRTAEGDRRLTVLHVNGDMRTLFLEGSTGRYDSGGTGTISLSDQGKRRSCRGSFTRMQKRLYFVPTGIHIKLVREFYDCRNGPVEFTVVENDEYV